MRPLTLIADLTDLAHAARWPIPAVARLFSQVGASFGFERLRQAAGTLSGGDAYERQAVRRLVEDLLAEQAAVTRLVMDFAAGPQAGEDAPKARAAVNSWAALRARTAAGARETLKGIEDSAGPWTFAKLTIANSALRELTVAAR